MGLSIVDATTGVRTFGLVGVPLELSMAHQLLHLVSTFVFTANLALTDARAITDGVALVLGGTGGVVVSVATTVLCNNIVSTKQAVGLLVGHASTTTGDGLLLSTVVGGLRGVGSINHGVGLGIIDATTGVRTFGLVGIPLELSVAHQLLHLVSTFVFTANLALTDARAITDGVALVLGGTGGVVV
eukprot:PhF_6_TR24489/c0_g1_i2/m.33853